ncbi:unnamed protein product [Adineta ricciae]|uniref:C-type lectin domain-containing protein n=2 Tax=Adineta ricciae TaxID=249248 RepID=A0A814MSK6_ADIRI|nr:unnamed protein product [Adineta ricciae]
MGARLAKVGDVVEIQDALDTELFDSSDRTDSASLLKMEKFFWIDRVSNYTTTNRAIRRCTHRSSSADPYCVVLRFEQVRINDRIGYEHCLTESDECPSQSATPVCVMKHLEPNATIVRPMKYDSPSTISIDTLIDYTCGNDNEYHLIEDYCYRIDSHETTWNEAKDKCERENASLFVPETKRTMTIMKELLLYHRIYTWSGIVHIGLVYDGRKGTVVRDVDKNVNALEYSTNKRDMYDLCERSGRRIFLGLKSESIKFSYGYMDFGHDGEPSISCDEFTDEKVATVICQKAPIGKTASVLVKRLLYRRTNRCISNEQRYLK